MSQKALIEQVHKLTQDIGHAAAVADWPNAARLAEERSPLLMSIGPTQDPAALALIRRIQATDAAVLDAAGTARVELQAEFNQSRRQADAASQYLKAARF